MSRQKKLPLIRLAENRVRRNYLGGAGIDALHQKAGCADGDEPEEWLGSLVEAKNPGLAVRPGEGLSQLPDGELLRDVVEGEPEYYLGRRYREEGLCDFGFLAKILDSSMRLHVQAHPTATFAKKYLHSRYGKLECYVILGVREGTEGYIRLGFQKPVTRAEWKRIIETQDLAAMDALFEKIQVAPGEVWYIPGGMPHAIGENITMLEVMEPSDLVVRCEFEREGIVVPKEGRFMGKGLDFCLDIFDYTAYSPAEIRRDFCVTPQIISSESGACFEELIGPQVTACFRIFRLTLAAGASYICDKENYAALIVAFQGAAVISTEGVAESLKAGDSLLAAAETSQVIFKNEGAEPAVLGLIRSC